MKRVQEKNWEEFLSAVSHEKNIKILEEAAVGNPKIILIENEVIIFEKNSSGKFDGTVTPMITSKESGREFFKKYEKYLEEKWEYC